MPSLIHSPFSRRQFFRTAGLGAAILSTGLSLPLRAANPAKGFRVALLSDTHIPGNAEDEYRGFKPAANLRRIAPEVVEAKPELVIVNGDAARLEGKVEDYQALSELLQPIVAAAPVCISMGNHDDRTNFGSVFKAVAGEKQPVAGKNVMVIEHAAARLLVLDSLMYVNKSAGQLGKAQRAWLSNYLPAMADRPAILFVHHTLEDNDGELTDVERLFTILKANPHVKAIIYGHSHVWSIRERQGVQLINLPAVGYNFRDQDPVGWVDSRIHPEGIDLTLRAFAGNTAENGRTFEVKWA